MKIIKILSNWKTIVTSLLITLPILAWIHDTRYPTHNQVSSLLIKHSIDKLYDEIAVLEINKGIANGKQIQMDNMNIALKLNRINKLKSK